MVRLLDWRAAGMVALLLAGCTPPVMRPTVQVLPGRNVSPDTFASDDASCKAQAQGQATAQRQVNSAANANDPNNQALIANGEVGSAILNMATQNAINEPAVQQQYDTTYLQCMLALGNVGPGGQMAVAPTPVVTGYDPGLVRAVQVELIRVGMLHDAADGAYGPHTRNAISNYQQANNLPVNGAPSDALLANLRGHSAMNAGLVQPVGSPAPATQLVAPVPAAPSGGDQMAQPVATAPASGGLSAPVATPASNP